MLLNWTIPANFTNDTNVLEVDPALECKSGWHRYVYYHGVALTCLFVLLTAPLQIVTGQIDRLHSSADWNHFRRFWNRINPQSWIQPPQYVWPRYVGTFALRHTCWYFEIAMLCCKIIFPLIQQMTTFNALRRRLLMFGASFCLVITVATYPPFMNPKMCIVLFLGCLVLLMTTIGMIIYKLDLYDDL